MDFISLGLDIASFDETKKARLNEFISLFNTLSEYDGKKFTPILGEGLTEFNNAVLQTNKLLEELNVKLSTLGSTSSVANRAISSTTKATDESTYASRELAKINELLDKTYAKLALATSDEAKALQVYKVQLNEATRATAEEAKQQSATYQLREANKRKIEEEKEQRRQLIAQQKAQLEQDRLAAIEQRKIQELQASGMRIMSDNTNTASTSAEGLGRSLTRGLGTLRTLAYILPGIGLAGIFNLAFEAISAATEALFKYEQGTEALILREQRLNDQLSDLRNNLTAVNDLILKSVSLTKSDEINESRTLELTKARGLNQKTILEDEIKINEIRLKNASFFTGSTDAAAEKKIKEAENKLANISGQIANVNAALERNGSYVDPQTKSYITDQDEIKQKKKSLEGQFQEEKAHMDDLISLRQKNIDATIDLEKKRNEYQKFLADQERKFTLETTKDNLQVRIEANQAILKDDRTTADARINAVKRIYSENVGINKATLNNVLSDPTTNPREVDIAKNKFADDNKKALIKQNEEIEKINIEFYQRRLKAETEISKDQVEKEALVNEKIFKNDQKSLEEKLYAYSKYIIEKQRLYQLDEQRDLQKGASSIGGKTSLTKDEVTAIKATSLKNQVDLQANAEKQIYDIVYSSTRKQLNEIVNFNNLTESDRKKSYTDEISDLNKLYENHKISYEKFVDEKTKLAKKYRLIELKNNVADDETELKRLQDFINKEKELRQKANDEVEIRGTHLSTIKANGGDTLQVQREYDEAVGRRNALDTTILDTDKELKKAQDKLSDDQLAYELAKFDALKKAEKEHAQFRKDLIESVFNLAKTAIDGEYEYKIQKSEERQRVIDEEYDNEISAIEKSSLTSKDKAAQDIQLQAEKNASDKNAAFEERKLKHDQAIVDRELAIAHILWSTEEAVMNALALSTVLPGVAEGLAAERATLGAIAVATVLASPIPYAQGTPIGGHQFPDKKVLIGEAGLEMVKEPYKSEYFVNTPTVTYLPKGTEVIPMKDLELETTSDNGWEQTRWLAKQIVKSNKKEIKNVFKPLINVDLGFEFYKRKILGN